MAAREVFKAIDGVPCPAPAPRFSRTPSTLKPIDASLHDPADIAREWSER